MPQLDYSSTKHKSRMPDICAIGSSDVWTWYVRVFIRATWQRIFPLSVGWLQLTRGKQPNLVKSLILARDESLYVHWRTDWLVLILQACLCQSACLACSVYPQNYSKSMNVLNNSCKCPLKHFSKMNTVSDLQWSLLFGKSLANYWLKLSGNFGEHHWKFIFTEWYAVELMNKNLQQALG